MAKPIPYQYKQNGSINLFVNNAMVTIGNQDMNYPVVAAALKSGNWAAVLRSINIKSAIAEYTNGRVEIFGDDIHIDKKALPTAVAARVLTMFRQTGFDMNPAFRLLENIEANPADFSRAELFLFLEQNQLPFTADGHFLAYKTVRADYTDWYSGTVNNSVGQTPFMNRDDVDPERHRTCSAGLHFCSYSYLGSFGGGDGHLMVLKINPADVVSIPSDYNNSKGRCWKYEVVDEIVDKADTIKKDYTSEYAPETLIVPKNGIKKTVVKEEIEDTDVVAPDYSAKLDAAGVRKIRKMIEAEWTIAGIAREFGISARQVARIRDGEAWADVK